MHPLQIRYAALDAYAILLLYNRCAEWASRLGMRIADITNAQERIRIPLPLFFDRNAMKTS